MRKKKKPSKSYTPHKKKPDPKKQIQELKKQISKLEKKLKKPEKKQTKYSKLEREILNDFEEILFQEELEQELYRDVEEIILSEKQFKPDYKKINPKELKYKGKKVSDEFNELVYDAARAANKHPQDILDNPNYREIIDDLIQKNKATTFKTTSSLIKYVDKANKEFVTIRYPDGTEKEVKTEEAVKDIADIEQTTRKEKDLVYIGMKIIHRIDGKIIIFLPNKSKKKPEEYEFADIWTFLNSDDAEYLIYDEQEK